MLSFVLAVSVSVLIYSVGIADRQRKLRQQEKGKEGEREGDTVQQTKECEERMER